MRIRAFMPVFISALIMQCAPKATVVDTPGRALAEDHYESGMYALARKDWQEAALSFNRTMKADPTYANGYAGAALVLALKGQRDKAIEFARKAVDMDSRSLDAQISLGRVLLLTKPDGWFNGAIKAFDTALKISPGNEHALFYKAEAYFDNGRADDARPLYDSVADKRGNLAAEARDKLKLMARYKDAAPRTAVGEKLMREKAISRADLAALLANEFNLSQVIHRRNPNYTGGANASARAEEQKRRALADKISDISGNWAEDDIREVVALGGLDIFPDNTFRPNVKMQRMGLVMTLQNIVIQATGNTALYTAFISAPPVYADVKRTHYAYNAVALVTEYNILPARPDTNRFDLDGPVSALEALSALRNLENYLSGAM